MGAAALTVFAVQVLTLADAVKTAESHAPQIHQARASTDAARARSMEALVPMLPQVNASGTYSRLTANFAAQPGSVPKQFGTGGTGMDMGPTFDTFNYWDFRVGASQLIFDFGYSPYRWKAAHKLVEGFAASEQATRLQIVLNVHASFNAARAQKALTQVARETLANQERHLAQIEGFVTVGTRPEIDLAQARTDRANSRFQLITAESNYESARAQLNQAMGVEGPTDYDVADEPLPTVTGEAEPIDKLVDEAARARPDIQSLERQIQSQELTNKSTRGAYFPSLSATTLLTDRGQDIKNLVWNWTGSLVLSWNITASALTFAQLREGEANLQGLIAQRDLLRQQVRLEVDQARLAVRSGKEGLVAAAEALANASERLRLAEGRYQAGVGSIIELGDAQLALTNAAAQKVQSEYNLATARAQLTKALARF